MLQFRFCHLFSKVSHGKVGQLPSSDTDSKFLEQYCHKTLNKSCLKLINQAHSEQYRYHNKLCE